MTRVGREAQEGHTAEAGDGKGRDVDGDVGRGVGLVACEGDEVRVGGAVTSASISGAVDGDGTVAISRNVPISDGAPSECVILHTGEVLQFSPRKFLHCTIVFEQNDRLYHTLIHRRVQGICDPKKKTISDLGLDSEKLKEEAEEIPLDVFPRYSAEEFGNERRCLSDDSVYIKRPSLRSWDRGCGNRSLDHMRGEMSTFQQLTQAPHANIVKFKGCVVRKGRVIALCLEKLECTLRYAVECKELWMKLDKDRVMSSICQAVEHLHQLGICHNDIGPNNVMLDSKNNAILIDFDSSMPVGSKLCKGGTRGWAEYDDFVSAKSNDTDAMARLKAFLLKGPAAK